MTEQQATHKESLLMSSPEEVERARFDALGEERARYLDDLLHRKLDEVLAARARGATVIFTIDGEEVSRVPADE